MNAASHIRAAAPPAWATSVDIWVMFRPKSAYRQLADSSEGAGKWIALRRPLAIALLAGCVVSLIASQRLTLRHVAGAALSAGLLVLAQIGVLALVSGRRRAIPFARALDLYFASYGPWIAWMLVFSCIWAFLPEQRALQFIWTGSIVVTGGSVMLWSLYLDYRFFRGALERSRGGAIWDAARVWALSWCVCVVICGWSAIPSEFARFLSA